MSKRASEVKQYVLKSTHGHLGTSPTDWELSQFGKTTDERLHHIASDAISYRGRAHLVKNGMAQKVHDDYIHKVGAEMLELLPGESKEEIEEKIAMAKKSAAIGKTLKRRVRVSEMNDGGMSIAIDLEWDTTTWSNEEIEAACSALTMVFEERPSMERKRQALRMLSKLLERHTNAVAFLRKDIENLINKCINRRLTKTGKSAGKLDILHVIMTCVNRYHSEYCYYNYTGRFCEMAILEAKLAAVIIQHAWRSQRELKTKRRVGITIGKFAEGFGDTQAVYRQRVKTINMRTQTLKNVWILMHATIPKGSVRTILYGVRGPVHIGEEYMLCGLNTILYLVSSKTRKLAPDNREGIFKCHGLMFLSSFVSACSGPFAIISCKIISEIAKSPECVLNFLHSGCCKSVLKFIKYLRKSPSLPGNENSSNLIQVSVLALTRIAVHIAGFFRVKCCYVKRIPERKDINSISYKSVLADFGKVFQDTDGLVLLGNKPIITELISLLLECTEVILIRRVLHCLYALSCSECGETVLEEVVAFGGRCLQRLVSLLDEELGESPIENEDKILLFSEDLGGPDAAVFCESLATVSLCILLQLCTIRHGRAALLTTGITRMLKSFVANSALNINPSYNRANLVLAALCRRGGGFDQLQGLGDWRAHDPETFEVVLHQNGAVLKYVYIDMLMSLRHADPNIVLEASTLDIAIGQLILLPQNLDAALEFANNSFLVGPHPLCDCLVHPDNSNYFNTLNWEMAAAGCIILDALTMSSNVALKILSFEVVVYLGRCIRVSFDELASARPKSTYISSIILNGVSAATEAAARLCIQSQGNITVGRTIVAGFRDANAIIASRFFIGLLSESHHYLHSDLHDLQDRAAMSSVTFLDKLCGLLLLGAGHGHSKEEIEEEIEELTLEVGSILCKVIGNLKNAFGPDSIRTAQVLHMCCELLTKLCATKYCVDEAIRAWDIMALLRSYLPSTLSGVDQYGTNSMEFRTGLGMLSPSFYDLLSRLCTCESGRSAVLMEGFLRRALDTVRVVAPSLESEKEHEENAYRRKCGQDIVPPRDERHTIAACIRLVRSIANFHKPSSGSSNDLILSEAFNFVPLCVKVLHSKACYRKDNVFEACLGAMSQLSEDVVHTLLPFKINDVASCFENELRRSSELSLDGATSCANYFLNVSMGIRRANMRLHELLPQVREGLFKLSRYHPSLSQLVADAIYASTKASGFESKDIDSTFDKLKNKLAKDDVSVLNNEQILEMSEEDQELCKMLPSDSILNELVFLSAKEVQKAELKMQMALSAKSINDPSKNTVEYLAIPGTYEICGVGSCGTLHNKDSPDKHGSDSKLPYSLVQLGPKSPPETINNSKVKELNFSKLNSKQAAESEFCEVSHLSAREKDFRDLLLERKMHNGFVLRPGQTGELPILTIAPARAEDFGKGAQPGNRNIFNKPIKRFEEPVKSASTLKDINDASLAIKSSVMVSPISSKHDGKKSGKSIVMNNNIQQINLNPPQFEVINIEQLPDLILTRPPPKKNLMK